MTDLGTAVNYDEEVPTIIDFERLRRCIVCECVWVGEPSEPSEECRNRECGCHQQKEPA